MKTDGFGELFLELSIAARENRGRHCVGQQGIRTIRSRGLCRWSEDRVRGRFQQSGQEVSSKEEDRVVEWSFMFVGETV